MYTNRLAREHSPYLRQHQHNPVDWFPWGEEAFQKAAAEDKPIFLSIGYSTCYWCHVMEKDSFEVQEVAEVLNEHFVCIKVDREERPDVDAIYMDAVMHMTGRGGWPMSVFLTPDRLPFYGATFFPQDQFLSILGQLDRAWKEQRPALLGSANELHEILKVELPENFAAIPNTKVFETFVENLGESFDPAYGGFNEAPKFPPSGTLSLLLRAALRAPKSKALAMAEKRSSAWPWAEYMIILPGAFTATRPIENGSSPTSRKCSTTMRSSRLPTSKDFKQRTKNCICSLRERS